MQGREQRRRPPRASAAPYVACPATARALAQGRGRRRRAGCYPRCFQGILAERLARCAARRHSRVCYRRAPPARPHPRCGGAAKRLVAASAYLAAAGGLWRPSGTAGGSVARALTANFISFVFLFWGVALYEAMRAGEARGCARPRAPVRVAPGNYSSQGDCYDVPLKHALGFVIWTKYNAESNNHESNRRVGLTAPPRPLASAGEAARSSSWRCAARAGSARRGGPACAVGWR